MSNLEMAILTAIILLVTLMFGWVYLIVIFKCFLVVNFFLKPYFTLIEPTHLFKASALIDASPGDLKDELINLNQAE
ncbi:MAG: hypothetical protein HRT34_04795 [Alcanivorax sp.]|nr:hypothetical protein [Alcanivorax sp.]